MQALNFDFFLYIYSFYSIFFSLWDSSECWPTGLFCHFVSRLFTPYFLLHDIYTFPYSTSNPSAASLSFPFLYILKSFLPLCFLSLTLSPTHSAVLPLSLRPLNIISTLPLHPDVPSPLALSNAAFLSDLPRGPSLSGRLQSVSVKGQSVALCVAWRGSPGVWGTCSSLNTPSIRLDWDTFRFI